MVVFENGAAKKSDYRKFKIKSVVGANDFASLQEMLRRRFKRYHDAQKAARGAGEWQDDIELMAKAEPQTAADSAQAAPDSPPTADGTETRAAVGGPSSAVAETLTKKRKSKIPLSKGIRTAERKNDESWARMPDLVIIDGGKGQLNAAEEVFREMGIEGVKLISLAKRQEEVFVPNRSDSLRLPKHSQALHLLQRIRDEAHRFGITYHRSLRVKKGLHSQLDAIPGIGPRRRRALLVKFGSLEAIRDASIEEILTVEGMTRSAAEKLQAHL